MASLIYNSCLNDMARGSIDFDTDTFKVMLVTSTYSPNKDTHTKRSDVTNEVGASGTYASGGSASVCTVTNDTANDRITMAFASVNWTTATITARAAVIYKSRGGASSADELVAYVDFGADITSTADTFTVTFSSALTLQN
jgi:hypothetical protein